MNEKLSEVFLSKEEYNDLCFKIIGDKDKRNGLLDMRRPNIIVWAELNCPEGEDKKIFLKKVVEVVKREEQFAPYRDGLLYSGSKAKSEVLDSKPVPVRKVDGRVTVSYRNKQYLEFMNSGLTVEEFSAKTKITIEQIRNLVKEFSANPTKVWLERKENSKARIPKSTYEAYFKSWPEDKSITAFCREQGINPTGFTNFVKEFHPERADFKNGPSKENEEMGQKAWDLLQQNPGRNLNSILQEVGMKVNSWYKWKERHEKETVNATDARCKACYDAWVAKGKSCGISSLEGEFHVTHGSMVRWAGANNISLKREKAVKGSKPQTDYTEIFSILVKEEQGISVPEFCELRNVDFTEFWSWLVIHQPEWIKDREAYEAKIAEEAAAEEIAEDESKKDESSDTNFGSVIISGEEDLPHIADITGIDSVEALAKSEALELEDDYVYTVSRKLIEDALKLLALRETLRKLKDLM